MQADLCGISLATAPGSACYIPLDHRGAGGGLFGGEPVAGLIESDKALARLKPLLEDPSILKIGQNLKYDMQIFAPLRHRTSAHRRHHAHLLRPGIGR